MFDIFYHLVYSDYCLHFYIFIPFRPMHPLAFFRCFMFSRIWNSCKSRTHTVKNTGILSKVRQRKILGLQVQSGLQVYNKETYYTIIPVLVMVNKFRTIYPRGLNKGLVRSSMLASKFDMKHLKKDEERVDRNVVNMTIKIKTINKDKDTKRH